MVKFIIIFVILLSVNLISQDEAKEFSRNAIRLMNDGKFNEAIIEFEKAYQVSNGDSYFAYEIAHCHYQMKNYREAIFILDTLIRRDDAQIHYFQMLGNSYDFLGKKDAAINIYTFGLNKFPNAARLYTELGTAEAGRSKDDEAQIYWETAINKDPYYDETYYRLAIYHYSRKNYLAAIYFGELFLNTTFNENKFRDINRIVYESFNKSLCPSCPNNLKMQSDEILNSSVDFAFYEKVYNFAYQNAFGEVLDSLRIKDILKLKNQFLKEWKILNGFSVTDSKLVEYLDIIDKENYFEDYHYWLLSEGNQEDFMLWARPNYKRFTEFIEWKTETRILLK